MHIHPYTIHHYVCRGDFLTIQKGNNCASSWMNRKIVRTVMYFTLSKSRLIQRLCRARWTHSLQMMLAGEMLITTSFDPPWRTENVTPQVLHVALSPPSTPYRTSPETHRSLWITQVYGKFLSPPNWLKMTVKFRLFSHRTTTSTTTARSLRCYIDLILNFELD